MKMALYALAICLILGGSLITTVTLIRKEARNTRALLNKKIGATAQDSEGTPDSLAQGLEHIVQQLSALNRRMTLLEEGIAAQPADTISQRRLNTQWANLPQELRELTAAQKRLNVLPGYLADLTRYLERSFVHVEERIAAKAQPNEMIEILAEMAQRLDLMEEFFAPVYQALGMTDKPEGPELSLETLRAQLERVDKEVQEIRKDIRNLREWMTPRNLAPGERP